MLNKCKLFCCLLLLIAGSAGAQQVDYARGVIRTLASPAFKGRGYVGNGDKIASAYIARTFQQSGLLPLNQGSYFQEFNLPVNTFPGKVELALNGMKLKTAVDYLVDARSAAVAGKFDVISVKRSEINTVEKVLALVNRASNAFILVDLRADKQEQPEETKAINAHIEALKFDSSLSFKGLLLYTTEKLTWTTLREQGIRPIFIINKKDIDPAQVKQVKASLDATFIPAYTTRNVAGLVKGTSGIDSTLVITAHYDHLGMLGNKVYFPGANDNASGVAMLLSLAKYYAAHPPKYNMLFLAFSGEEIGILGSQAYVENPLTDLSRIKFLVNFDLAGTGEEGLKVVNGSIFKKQFDSLVEINKREQLVTKIDIRGEACNSDHCRFYAKGVPSFFIYTQGGIPAYHDVYDRAETLSLTAFQNYFNLMLKFFEQQSR